MIGQLAYCLTAASALDPAKITQSANYRLVTDTEKSTWNGKQDAGLCLLATGATVGGSSQAQVFTNGVKTGKIFPASDSTTAFQINKADGSTNVLNVDTTNGCVGIGTTAPGARLNVNGNIQTNSQLILTASSGSGSDIGFYNTRPFSNHAVMNVYPSSASVNINSTLAVIPKGTGVSGNLAQLSIYGTDLVADSTNYEFSGLRNTGVLSVLATGKAGTGTNRPLMLAAGYLSDNSTNNGQLYLATSGNVGIGTTAPTAKLHLKAGTATASTAPLKFTSGVNLTNPEAGAMEFDGTNFFLTPDTIRKKIALLPNSAAPAYTTSNVTEDRTFDANATSVEELADILGTLIADLKLTNIIQ